MIAVKVSLPGVCVLIYAEVNMIIAFTETRKSRKVIFNTARSFWSDKVFHVWVHGLKYIFSQLCHLAFCLALVFSSHRLSVYEQPVFFLTFRLPGVVLHTRARVRSLSTSISELQVFFTVLHIPLPLALTRNINTDCKLAHSSLSIYNYCNLFVLYILTARGSALHESCGSAKFLTHVHWGCGQYVRESIRNHAR